MAEKVKFAHGTKAEYENLSVKDPNTLYFLEDVGKIYKGDILQTGFGKNGNVFGNLKAYDLGKDSFLTSFSSKDVDPNVDIVYKEDGTIDVDLTIGKWLDRPHFSAALGDGSIVSGLNTITFGVHSHAEGEQAATFGDYSHAEGYGSSSHGKYSHAEGYLASSIGENSHAEGKSTDAVNENSHAEGLSTHAKGKNSHAEGEKTTAYSVDSHAEGTKGFAYGQSSHIEGSSSTEALETWIVNQPKETVVEHYNRMGGFHLTYGNDSHGEGKDNLVLGDYSHAEGSHNLTFMPGAHAEGSENEVHSWRSHAEGSGNVIYTAAIDSHAEGFGNSVNGENAHVEGSHNHALGKESHAEGLRTLSFGDGAHVEGNGTYPSSLIGEFNDKTKDEIYNFWNNKVIYPFRTDRSDFDKIIQAAVGSSSHSEGARNMAFGDYSHTEGNITLAKGEASHSEGYRTIANGNYSHVQGIGNIEDAENKYAHIVGNGKIVSEEGRPGYFNLARSNAHTLDWDGNAWYAGKVSVGENVTVDNITDNKDLTTKEYVDNAVSKVSHIIPNVILHGEPSIQWGQVRGFSEDNYLQFPKLIDFAGREFEIDFSILTGPQVTTQENIIDSEFGLAFAISNGKFIMALSGDGHSWDVGVETSTINVLPNTPYSLRIYYKDGHYGVKMLNGQGEYEEIIAPIESTASLSEKPIYIGIGNLFFSGATNYFSGMIDLTESKLFINGNLEWTGIK